MRNSNTQTRKEPFNTHPSIHIRTYNSVKLVKCLEDNKPSCKYRPINVGEYLLALLRLRFSVSEVRIRAIGTKDTITMSCEFNLMHTEADLHVMTKRKEMRSTKK